MSSPLPHITVCILTCNRAAWLDRLLAALETQRTDGEFTFSARVVDNDPAQSAKPVVERRQAAGKVVVAYDFEPQKNLAMARNRAALNSPGEFVAYIDDDEFPVPEWLWKLFDTRRTSGADGVLGPVRPHFETPPPAWMISSKVFERPVHPTGLVLTYDQTRTGNVLLRRKLFELPENLFNTDFAMHGEDRDFFKRLIAKGHKFVWCEEAPAYETQPADRCCARYHIRRALLRGSISWRHAPAKAKTLALTLTAFTLYTVALPFLLLGGSGLFMKYLIKDCDHAGRLLSAGGIKVERYMKTP